MKYMIKIITFALLLISVNYIKAQVDTVYTKWSFSLAGSYLIQEDVGINSPTSFFNFQNTLAPSGGLSYQVVDKEQFEIWAGFNILYFAPKTESLLKSNSVEYNLGLPPPKDYEDAILRVPISYKGSLLQSVGLKEFFTLNYNIPLYRYETIISVSYMNELVYRTIATANKNYFSAALGIEKSIYTKPFLFEVGAGFSMDFNDFYDGTVRLGDGTSKEYHLRTNSPFIDLSIRPRKFKLLAK